MIYVNALSFSKDLCKSVKDRSFCSWTQEKTQKVEGTSRTHQSRGWSSEWENDQALTEMQYQGTEDKPKNETSYQNGMRQVLDAPSWVFAASVPQATSIQ